MATILERNKNIKPAQQVKKTRADYAEDALYREVWEEVNNEKTIAFLKKYSKPLMAGALAIMIVVTGIQIGVRSYRNARTAQALTYETAVMSGDSIGLSDVFENASGAMADLALFQAYMLDNDISKLERLAAHGNTRDYRDLARMHIVMARGDDMSADDVAEYLDGLNTKKSPYFYTSRLVVAQKYLSDGNRAAANKWLDVIINDTSAPASVLATAQTLR